MRFLALIFCTVNIFAAAMIPSGRLPFGGTFSPGVVGGIPHRTTIFTNFTSSMTVAQLNAAINLCPSNQVIQLAAGNYNLSGQITFGWPNGMGITVRGSGTNTILTYSDMTYFQFVPSDFFDFTDTNRIANWTSGYTQGTTNITVDHVTTPYSHQDLQPGTLLFLNQLNDTNVGETCIVPYNDFGSHYSFLTNDAGAPFGGNRLQVQAVRVTAVNGNNITFWPPLAMTNWSGSLSPQACWFGLPVEMTGLEDLAIDASVDTYDCMPMAYSYNCWLSNIVVINSKQTGIDISKSVNSSIVHCTVRGSQSYGAGSYGIVVAYSSGILVENNIIDLPTAGILCNMGNELCVFGYNYITPNAIYISSGNSFMPSDIATHEPHSCMNLFEGNYCGTVELDFTHGSGSHQTFFRNRIHGGPNRVTQTQNTFPFNIQSSNRWINVVGNVLGNINYHTNAYQLDETTVPGSAKTIYRLDFNDDGGNTNYFDSVVKTSVIRHMNYDAFDNAVIYDGSIEDTNLVNSYYLSSKPSWFGNCPYPPYNPLSASSAVDTNLPAVYRFINGIDPPGNGPAQLKPHSKLNGNSRLTQ